MILFIIVAFIISFAFLGRLMFGAPIFESKADYIARQRAHQTAYDAKVAAKLRRDQM